VKIMAVDIVQLLLGTSNEILFLSVATLFLRIFVGILFIIHGMPKLFNRDARKMMRDSFKSFGIPYALFDLVALLEFLGGIALLIGLLTKIVSLLFVLEMIGTTILNITKLYNAPMPRGALEPMFKATRGYMFGWELDTVLLASSFAIFLIGPGIFSIDNIIFLILG
jgi:putative oxidoreductase